ncbi:unnamed protein product [Pipistrellus nathusii]|uniref:Uncharacterized protein n=1 Tax=Pipistrellus nathusii TaxID=59473 RepID=A0ABN9ZGL9_PIPNA
MPRGTVAVALGSEGRSLTLAMVRGVQGHLLATSKRTTTWGGRVLLASPALSVLRVEGHTPDQRGRWASRGRLPQCILLPVLRKKAAPAEGHGAKLASEMGARSFAEESMKDISSH